MAKYYSNSLATLFERLREPEGNEFLYSEELTYEVMAGNEEIVPLLLELLVDRNNNVRFEAVRGLWVAKDKRAVKPLIQILLSDSDYDIRRIAARALGELKDPEAIEPLLYAATHDPKIERLLESIFEALHNFDDDRVVDFFQEKMNDGLFTRFLAIQNLCYMHNPKVLEIFLSVLSEEWINDPQNIEAVARRDIAVALGEWRDDRRVFPKLMEILEKGTLAERLGATIGLGKLGDPEAIESLALTLNEDNVEKILGDRAAISLGQLGDERGILRILDAVENDYYQNNEPWVFCDAVTALVHLDGEGATPILEKFLGNEYKKAQEENEYLEEIISCVSKALESIKKNC